MFSSATPLFSQATPKQVVVTALRLLQAHYEYQADRLNKILAGEETLDTEQLSKIWERLVLEGVSCEEAFSTLNQAIEAELDATDVHVA